MVSSLVLTFALWFAAFIALLCAVLVALRENKRKKQMVEELEKLRNNK